ncbi:MAG TPA: HNH endonuclease, partial [Candidatus Dormibacteraeota bacterium]|nr:HNH endonuclease [Candidatus Dormibacteraeota bacterium]
MDDAAFWKRVKKGDGCWEFQAKPHKNGYCNLQRNYTTWLAHRWSYLLHYPDFNPSLCVLHKCDNRRCVRPD